MKVDILPKWLEEKEKQELYTFVEETYCILFSSDIRRKLKLLTSAFHDIFAIYCLINPEYVLPLDDKPLQQSLFHFMTSHLSDDKRNLLNEKYYIDDIASSLLRSNYNSFYRSLNNQEALLVKHQEVVNQLCEWMFSNPTSFFFLTLRVQPELREHIISFDWKNLKYDLPFPQLSEEAEELFHPNMVLKNYVSPFLSEQEPYISLLPAFDYSHVTDKQIRILAHTQLHLPEEEFTREEIFQLFSQKEALYDNHEEILYISFAKEFFVDYEFTQNPTSEYVWDVFMKTYFPASLQASEILKEKAEPHIIQWLTASRSMLLASERTCYPTDKEGINLQFYVSENKEKELLNFLDTYQTIRREPEASQYASWGMIHPSIVYKKELADNWEVLYTPHNCEQSWEEVQWVADEDKIFNNILKNRLFSYPEISTENIWLERRVSVNGLHDVKISSDKIDGFDCLSDLLINPDKIFAYTRHNPNSDEKDKGFTRIQWSLSQLGLVLNQEHYVFDVNNKELAEALVRYRSFSTVNKNQVFKCHDSLIGGVEQLYYAQISIYYISHRILKQHGLLNDNDFDKQTTKFYGQPAISSEKGRLQLIGWGKSCKEIVDTALKLQLILEKPVRQSKVDNNHATHLSNKPSSEVVVLRSPDKRHVFTVDKHILTSPPHLEFPGGSQIIHGITAGTEAEPELSLNSFKNIVEHGGLLSTRNRRQHFINCKTSSPMGDICSGIDHGIPSSITHEPFYGDNILLIISKAIMFHKSVWLAPYDYGSGESRAGQYQEYAKSLGQPHINIPPSFENRQKHLLSGMDKDNEIFIRGSISAFLFKAMFVRDVIFEQTAYFVEQQKALGHLPKDLQIIMFEKYSNIQRVKAFHQQFLHYMIQNRETEHPLNDLQSWTRI